LSYFDPSDAHDTNVKEKHENLVLHLDIIVMKNANDLNQLNKDSFYIKALPAKIDCKKLSPYFAFSLHNVIQHTSRQTTQLSNSTMHYTMRCHLKSHFQMLRQKKVNKVIAIDTFFSMKNQLKAIIMHKYFLE
jgi:hypothetical protein